ncbi:hypothetical protein OQA88_13014 [Cercophora sp. LCS_1]
MTDDQDQVNGLNGIDGAANGPIVEAGSAEQSAFSWLDPHPIFVIVMVGREGEETPFGIQKDFLCAKSSFYRAYFTETAGSDSLEYLVKLPDTPVEVFSYAQNFLYTGQVSPSIEKLPTYEVLIGVWKLGHELGIDGLCDATLEAMSECRRVTQHIPATPLLVQVWKDTPEGSSIRKLLLSWAAEYMRSSDSRAEFARSLPQEVLSELVVAMSSLEATPTSHIPPPVSPSSHRRTAQQFEEDDGEIVQVQPAKKPRYSDVPPTTSAPVASKPNIKRVAARQSLPAKSQKRRSIAIAQDAQFSTNQKLNFCADLLARMLSGPGFWTRLVGPFKEPVDPSTDGVPDYLEKVTRPMDLGTMKAKMDRREYTDEQEFLADMNQIFTNCYTYWTKKDAMWAACERLQKTFEEKYAQMNKWIAKMEGNEEH